MVRKIILSIILLLVYSCANTQTLGDGSKTLTKKYKNRGKFNSKIFELIDNNFFYKEIDSYLVDKDYVKTRQIGSSNILNFLQFYDDGSIRFLLYKEPNPEITGRRGIIYLKNNNLKIDTQFTNQGGAISKGTYSVKVDGNKLYLFDDNSLVPRSEYICLVFEKSEKIPEDWKKYKTDW
ncbi:hypothetical protein IQ37_00160 [Chryseobacterium piperi]|uniref:Lipoprotein n=1 Tax=Chryseobacterium piperi TaxID=558152 RepID=A0A086BMS2_9FLAO|nr:hypothetical protein [Chryseobacterium piperi]ASW75025.1 hypothetical protein CJF12_12565 [Chryseobacterium piperi]KFF30236.1 hypothetical protein IQ37_00160 [Chryseobacterium piperi]